MHALKPRTPPPRAAHTSPSFLPKSRQAQARRERHRSSHGDATAASRRRRRQRQRQRQRRRPRAGRGRVVVAAAVPGVRRAGERAVEPDQGAGGGAGGAVRARPAQPERGADTADHGQAAGARRHRGQERLLLVPEPQGTAAPSPEAGQLRLLHHAPPPAPAAARAPHAARAAVPSRPRPVPVPVSGAGADRDRDAAATATAVARCMQQQQQQQQQRRRAWYVYYHHLMIGLCTVFLILPVAQLASIVFHSIPSISSIVFVAFARRVSKDSIEGLPFHSGRFMASTRVRAIVNADVVSFAVLTAAYNACANSRLFSWLFPCQRFLL